MIKVDQGSVDIRGDKVTLAAELATVTHTLTNNDVMSDDEIRTYIEQGLADIESDDLKTFYRKGVYEFIGKVDDTNSLRWCYEIVKAMWKKNAQAKAKEETHDEEGFL